MLALIAMTAAPNKEAAAQIPIVDIIKGAVKKVIKAADLKIQRKQNKVIWLQNAQKVLENELSKLKLDEISNWTEKQRALYQEYFDELKKVKNILAYYRAVRDITTQQAKIVQVYRKAWQIVQKDRHFTPEELTYIEKVYSGILSESVRNMEQLALVVNAFETQMSDAKRLEIINTVAAKVQQNYNDLNRFNTQTARLSIQRAKAAAEIEQARRLYGIQ